MTRRALALVLGGSAAARSLARLQEQLDAAEFVVQGASEAGIARRLAGEVADVGVERAVALRQVGPADDMVAPQQWQRVVAAHALCRGRVGLETVGPAPQQFETVAVPDQWVEGREQAHCIVVVVEPWTVDNGVITPTFKVKRNRVDERFAAHYEQWERTRKKVIWHAG